MQKQRRFYLRPDLTSTIKTPRYNCVVNLLGVQDKY
jgi:hypothetical protein